MCDTTNNNNNDDDDNDDDDNDDDDDNNRVTQTQTLPAFETKLKTQHTVSPSPTPDSRLFRFNRYV